FPAVIPYHRAGSHALLTRLPLSPSRSRDHVRLACVRHAARVRSEPGSNSQVDLRPQCQGITPTPETQNHRIPSHHALAPSPPPNQSLSPRSLQSPAPGREQQQLLDTIRDRPECQPAPKTAALASLLINHNVKQQTPFDRRRKEPQDPVWA